jgi:Glycosyl transferase family 2
LAKAYTLLGLCSLHPDANKNMTAASNKPFVSVVMVVCNVERFLGEAIESILDQTYREFEFVIVDFGSSDKSKEIISSYAAKDSRIKFHEISQCGLAEARHQACLLAQGRYIAIMDADDISVPERLAWQVGFLDGEPQVGIVGGQVELIDAGGASLANSVLLSEVNLERPCGNNELQTALLSYCPFWQDAILMRREAFDKVGGYRAALVQGEDYDLWMRIAEHFELANLKQVVFKYRMHPHQVSVRKRKQQTLCSLSVRASAKLRKNGSPDPLNSVQAITPELLKEMGVGEAELQSSLAAEFRGWIQFMCAAGEWTAALNAARELLRSSDWKFVETRAVGDMYLQVAKLAWDHNRFWMSIVTAGQAVLKRPRVAGRPVRLLLERLGLA